MTRLDENPSCVSMTCPLGLEVAGARFDPKDSDIYSTVSAK